MDGEGGEGVPCACQAGEEGPGTDGATRLGPSDVVRSFDGPVGAYVQVPFCERICPFCPYNKVLAEKGLARRYFAALRREVEWYVGEQEMIQGVPFTWRLLAFVRDRPIELEELPEVGLEPEVRDPARPASGG